MKLPKDGHEQHKSAASFYRREDVCALNTKNSLLSSIMLMGTKFIE